MLRSVVTDNESGYEADDTSNSPTATNETLPLDDGSFFSSLAARRLLATVDDSSTDADDSGVSFASSTISKPKTGVHRAPRLSKKDRLQNVLTYLRNFKLSPMDLFAEVADKSNDEYEAYRVKMYGEPGREKLEEVLNLMMDDLRGRVVLRRWMSSHAFELVEQAIDNEMSCLSTQFNTTTRQITPSYIRLWSFEGNVATVIGKQCPSLLRIIRIAAESKKSSKNSKKDTSVVSICRRRDNMFADMEFRVESLSSRS